MSRAFDVRVLVLEQRGHAGRCKRDALRQHDAGTEEAGGHRSRRFGAHRHAHALHAALQFLGQLGRTCARHQPLDRDQVAADADQQDQRSRQPDQRQRQGKVGQVPVRQLNSGSVNSGSGSGGGDRLRRGLQHFAAEIDRPGRARRRRWRSCPTSFRSPARLRAQPLQALARRRRSAIEVCRTPARRFRA